MARNAGLTVLELLFALLVLGVLLGVGAPAMQHLLLDARLTAQVNQLVHGIHMARHTAQKRGHHAVLCKSADGAGCAPDGAWHEGWIVFINRDRDNPPQVDPDEPVLLVAPPYRDGSITANRQAFVFRPFEVRDTNGSLLVCDRRGRTRGRMVIISYTGRPRTAAATDTFNRTLRCEP
jgi:type IV fimbrial biogenesis protein FimT